jgi:hypothetical protein
VAFVNRDGTALAQPNVSVIELHRDVLGRPVPSDRLHQHGETLLEKILHVTIEEPVGLAVIENERGSN